MEEFRDWYMSASQEFPLHQRGEFPVARFTKLTSSLLDIGTATSVLEAPWINGLLNFLVSLMNDESTTARVKLSALLCLVHLSRVPNRDYRQQLLLPVALQMDAGFASMLEEKQQAAEELGTMLGKQHEYVVVMLMRCTNYELTGRDVLQEFCNGNQSLFLQILFGILKVQSYELELKVNCFMCLYAISLPNTYFGAENTSPSKGPQDSSTTATAFLEHIDKILTVCLSCNAMKTVTEVLTQMISSHESKLKAPLLAANRRPVANLATCVKYFSQFYINLFIFSSHGRNATEWRQSLTTVVGEFFKGTYLPLIDRLSVGLVDVEEASRPISHAVLGSLEAICAASALAVFGSSESQLTSYRKVSAYPCLELMKRIDGIDINTITVLVTRFLQLNVNLDSLMPNVPSPNATPEERSADGGMSDPTEMLLYRAILSHFSRLDVEEIVLLQRLATNCSSNLPLLSRRNTTFKTIEESLQRYADEKLNSMQPSESTNSLGSSEGAISDGEIDRITANLDREIAGLEQAISDTTATRQALNHLAHGEDVDLPSTPTDAPPTTGPENAGAFSTPRKKEKKSKKIKSKKVAKALLEVNKNYAPPHPPEFICCWSGALMKNPVILPSGNWYELSVLERIFDKYGKIDPVTSEPFDGDIAVNTKLQTKIQRYILQQAVQQQQ